MTKKTSQTPLATGATKKVSSWQNLASPRVQTLIRMKKERATDKKIGEAVGCTKERIRQVVKSIKTVHGEEIFASEKKALTIKEAANELGISTWTILYLCDKKEIPTTY